jgi:glutamate-1-semialdehyde 2,1-aminomutase
VGSDGLFERAVASLPGGNTRTTVYVPPRPPYAVRGEGYTVHDADGHSVIDLQANMSALVHGHAHPRITRAIADAASTGTSFGMPTESELQLAEHLTARMPALERVRFANSGTEAVMAALRLARAYAGKPAVLRFEGCYHGAYDGVLKSPRGVPPGLLADQVLVPWGDVDAFTAALAEHAGRVAAVLVDLMPNRAGLVPATPEFAHALRARTEELGVLLIVDEVITFRLEHGGLHAAYGLQPDLVTMGKAIGGGLPVGAFGGREDVMRLYDPREPDSLEHGGTFTGAPIVMRAGLASVELLDEAAIARINRLGDDLRARLQQLGLRANGRGSLTRILHDDPDELWWRLYRAGVLIGHNGLTCVCTAMDEAAVDEVVKRVATAVSV